MGNSGGAARVGWSLYPLQWSCLPALLLTLSLLTLSLSQSLACPPSRAYTLMADPLTLMFAEHSRHSMHPTRC